MDLLRLYLELNVGITLIPHCVSSHLYLTTCRLSYDPFTPTPLKLTKTTRNRPPSSKSLILMKLTKTTPNRPPSSESLILNPHSGESLLGIHFSPSNPINTQSHALATFRCQIHPTELEIEDGEQIDVMLHHTGSYVF
ncbi:hypothetical protein DEO72_LG10g4062 [Vigna unguiculata]|uniref:Uncharacterized protein n=1 Tax=Vigna unguiculata TaxID=3917 RepID=A0A4D6KN69_VIGUN|nr:hypothetical protein DEO72_LG1g1750 [Vigna unguiculata]QCE02728.1 hypothetical protein DEO72_LG8g743 [Vigna unguiculata]QCE12812.1 hypothetical protein DEO72_LG10g4062 [Vigna unguiculata]